MDVAREQVDECVRLVLAGNPEAFRGVVDACHGRVRIVLAAMLPDRSAVDDVAQEVFLAVYSKLSEYRPGTDFLAWVGTIARNHARNERRKWIRAGERRQEYRARVEAALEPLLTPLADRADEGLLQAMQDCIGKLEELSRRVIRGFYMESRSGRDIAAAEGRSEGWVRLVLFRARLAVAQCLQKQGVLHDA